MDIIDKLRIESDREPNEPIWREAIDEIRRLRDFERKIRIVLSRMPDINFEMYVGKDKVSWGQQVRDALK